MKKLIAEKMNFLKDYKNSIKELKVQNMRSFDKICEVKKTVDILTKVAVILSGSVIFLMFIGGSVFLGLVNTFLFIIATCLKKYIDKKQTILTTGYKNIDDIYDKEIEKTDNEIDAYYSVMEYSKGKKLDKTTIENINIYLVLDPDMKTVINKINSEYNVKFSISDESEKLQIEEEMEVSENNMNVNSFQKVLK